MALLLRSASSTVLVRSTATDLIHSSCANSTGHLVPVQYSSSATGTVPWYGVLVTITTVNAAVCIR